MDGSKDSPSIRISMFRLIPGSQGCATIPFIQTLTQRICTHELPTFSANLLFRCDAGDVEHSRIQSVLVVLDLVTMGLGTATRRAVGQPERYDLLDLIDYILDWCGVVHDLP